MEKKAYTDLEQSKQLAEILPIESADMEYMFLKKDGSKVSNVPFVKDGFEEPECCYIFIPCWSLTALLEVIPKRIKDCAIFRMDMGENDFAIWYDNLDSGTVDENLPDITTNSPIDACYEMIIKLHEQNLL